MRRGEAGKVAAPIRQHGAAAAAEALPRDFCKDPKIILNSNLKENWFKTELKFKLVNF